MDRSLHGWAQEFKNISMGDKTGEYDSDVIQDFRRIDAYALPTYHRIIVDPREFLKNLEEYEKNFVYPAYYAQVYPQTDGLSKYSLMNFKRLNELKGFLNEKIADTMGQYLLLVSEFEENIFGGSVMSDGRTVSVDIVSGLQNQLSYGSRAMCSCTVSPNGLITYNDGCGNMEKALFDELLEAITVLGNNDGENFMRGYFEFAFTKVENNDKLRLVFFDFKTDKRFYL